MSKKPLSFEESLKRLEEIVEKLEHPEVTLEQSIALFQEGMALSADCDTILQDAQEKITVLIEGPNETSQKEIEESDLKG